MQNFSSRWNGKPSRMSLVVLLVGILCMASTSLAFAPTVQLGKAALPQQSIGVTTGARTITTTTTTTLWSSDSSSSDNGKKSKKKAPYDEGVRKKLVAESIAPWRTLRLFLYGALGSGAAIGGFVQLTGFLAAISQNRPEIDYNTEYFNLAVDFGAVALFVVLFKWDIGKQKELDQRVEERLEKKKEQKQALQGMREREALLGTLQVKVPISTDGATRPASVRELQAGARQHLIIVAGPKKACRDALVGANLLKMDFAMSNVLVVPYETGVDWAELQSRPDGTGFGDRPIYERQPYVARPTGEGWDDYIKAEMEDAVKQNGEKAKEEGIAVVVASNGKVLRRGIGKVPWRQMVEQLNESVAA